MDFENTVTYLLAKLSLAHRNLFERAAVGAGLHSGQAFVLLELWREDGQRQIDLAAMTSIDVSTLSRVVTRLVRMGLVTRTRSATNSREVVVRLTGKGTASLARMIPRAIAAERRAIAGVPARDLAVVRRSLRRMYANLAGPSAG